MQEIFLKKLGEKIKHLRKERKLTLSALCYKNGLEPSTVSRIEKAQVDVKFLTLLKISKAFDMKIHDLVNL